MIVLTGAVGFIGSCILARLNAMGRRDILIVDERKDALKDNNLTGKEYEKYFDKKEFLEIVKKDKLTEPIDAVIHMGASSSTVGIDKKYYEENNFAYTQQLALWCLRHKVRFIYGSSAATYGDGSCGYSDDERILRRLKPLNFYGWSKHKFDLWAWENKVLDKMVGLKFFNVFGPNEYHKGEMRSVVAKAYERVMKEGKMLLFKSYRPDDKDGEQKRDFIYVKDAVDVVLFFLEHPNVNGIFNVGTGVARTWNDLAKALFTALGKPVNIEYIEMPENLRSQYQYFTQADISKLKKAGYTKPFTPLEIAVKDYVGYLKNRAYI